MRCAACGSENPEGKRFCEDCGTALLATCSTCGARLGPGKRFCGECGTPAGATTAATSPLAAPLLQAGAVPGAQPEGSSTTELRQVSILFCDLVGFTTLAEHHDAEETREVLSGYFDLARATVANYGGVVEKFIGDAVMAVWGAPIAREDDAERAVRAGLELVSAVVTYGTEHAGTELSARVGVVTGTVATAGRPDQGLVVGDRVNTASRIQSVALPGSCYVDDATRRATEAAIVYADAGQHRLKGKAEPLRLHRALRVVAGVGGALKSEGLEAPFVGRDRELRLVKDLLHASAETGRAHLVSVSGVAGIGKSRLGWEFYKYLDGLSEVFRWHRGRCLSYGEGVSYWALAEMVRGRAGIGEGEDPSSAASKLRAAVEDCVVDPQERRWVEGPLANLLGLDDGEAREREQLFAGWRLFFERMAERDPVVLSFEDMQWADSSLLDFVEYLLDWSRNHAIFVLSLARPELLERRPNWGAGRRNHTSIYLDTLPSEAMSELVDGLVPGLPGEARQQILSRAEGVPLYAVETVRMMIDRGLVVRHGSGYELVGSLDNLDIPETLHALIAARLDGLSTAERSLLQDAAVVGKSFPRTLIMTLTGLDPAVLDDLLASLVRKEIIAVQADPLSAERGQHGFLQDLVRSVAYEMLTRRDRKDRHLQVATWLEASRGADDDELAAVIASHYLAAYALDPASPDAARVKSAARAMLARAGERAAAVAATGEAQAYFERALELSEEVGERAVLEERAGQMAQTRGRMAEASAHLERAINCFASADQGHAAARVAARLGEIDFVEGRLDKGIERMEQAFSLLVDDEVDEDLVSLAVQLGRLHLFGGERELAMERNEFALRFAELLDLPEQLSQGLNTKAVALRYDGRRQEASLLLQHALDIAVENDLSTAALRALNNLAAFAYHDDEYTECATHAAAFLELARRVGNRGLEVDSLAGALPTMVMSGQWDEAMERVAELRSGDEAITERTLAFLLAALRVLVGRGDLDASRQLFAFCAPVADSDEVQTKSEYLASLAVLLEAEGRHDEALETARAALRAGQELATSPVLAKDGFVVALEAACALSLEDDVERLLERIERLYPGERSPFLQAHGLRFRARLCAGGEAKAETDFAAATSIFRRIGTPFWLAVVLLEHGEWLSLRGRTAEAAPFLAEARQIFERLAARPWLERLELDERAAVATG